jgi:hypothetical protein
MKPTAMNYNPDMIKWIWKLLLTTMVHCDIKQCPRVKRTDTDTLNVSLATDFSSFFQISL